MKGLALALALSLAAGSPAFGPREPTAQRVPVGTFLKLIHTVDGDVAVYRVREGCQLWFRGVPMQTVDRQTCAA